MTKADVLKLFDMLNSLYPNSPHPEKDKNKVLAWTLAFESCSYEDVKQAVLANLKRSRFFPDPAELWEVMPKQEAQLEENKRGPDSKDLAAMRWLQEYYRDKQERCSEAGIPTALEAREKGMSVWEWVEIATQAGI